jgi:hypothetical protein
MQPHPSWDPGECCAFVTPCDSAIMEGLTLMFSKVRFFGTLAIATLTACAVQAAPGDFTLFGNSRSGEGTKKNETSVVLISDNAATEPYAGIAYFPPTGKKATLTEDITELSVTYKILEGGFGAGSLRFSVGVDEDQDGTADGYIFVYAGTAPNFDDEPGDWVQSGNLLATDDLRVDTSQIGGTFYDTWEHALELTEGAAVTEVLIVVDAGYAFEVGVQAIAVSEVQIGNAKFKAKVVGKGNR